MPGFIPPSPVAATGSVTAAPLGPRSGGSTPGRAYAVTGGADGAEELVALVDDGVVHAENYSPVGKEAV